MEGGGEPEQAPWRGASAGRKSGCAMSRATAKRKPIYPAKADEPKQVDPHDPEHWGADPKALRHQPGVNIVWEREPRTNKRTGKVQAAQRQDVFHRLHARGALTDVQLTAVRRLETDMAERRGEGDRPAPGMAVDCSGSRAAITDRQIAAGDRIDGHAPRGVLLRVGLRDAVLLREMLDPRRVMPTSSDGLDGRPERWRTVVTLVAGESRYDHQTTVLKGACDNLALAYREIDQGL